jgi:RHS repeat-associated protein
LPNVVFTSAYDYNDNRTSLKANIGGTLNADGSVTGGTNDFQNAYIYNTLGQMTSVSQTAQTSGTDNGVTAKTATFSYDADERSSTIAMYQFSGTGNQVANAANTYDADSRLTDLRYVFRSSGGPTYLAAYHWTYDADSRVTNEYSLDDTAGTKSYSAGYATWAHTTYGYDHNSQLTSTSYSTFAIAPTSNTSAAFDYNGNRTSTNSVTSASSTNLLLFDGTYYYQYDAAGNRTARYQNAVDKSLDSHATNITIYGWNNANELVSVKTYGTYSAYSSSATPASEVDYGYDPFGEMVSRTVKNSSGTVTSAADYIYDGANPVLVLNASGQVTERNLYGPAVNQIMATETVTPVSMGEQAAGLVNWLLPNNQGTVRDVVQYSGVASNVVDHLVYDSFGNITAQTNATYQPFITYAGMMYDTATGLYYDNARWYDATNSVFISQDPIGFNDGGTNLAMYCWNNPTNGTDPSGMFGWMNVWGFAKVVGGVAVTVGGVVGGAATSWSGVGIVAGGALAVEGVDIAQAGFRQAWSGEQTNTATFNTAEAATEAGLKVFDADGWKNDRDFQARQLRFHEENGTLAENLRNDQLIGADRVDTTVRAGANTIVATYQIVGGLGEESVGIEVSAGECFVAGTLVATIAGSLAIENIRANDLVWAYDLALCVWRPCSVKRTFEHSYVGKYITVTIAGDAIVSTFNHPYWVTRGESLGDRPDSKHTENRPEGATIAGRWVDAGHLRTGDELLLRDGGVVPVLAVLKHEASGTVYNIEVDHLECYAVGNNNILVHNKPGVGRPVWESDGPITIRTGPRGVDPLHHNVNVLVVDSEGYILSHTRIVSGNMTPAEKALGFPSNSLASHTEARAVRQIPLEEG